MTPDPTARDVETARALSPCDPTWPCTDLHVGENRCASCRRADAISAALATARAEERERAAKLADLHAERLKHTSHMDGPGMGWSRGEQVCADIATAIRAREGA